METERIKSGSNELKLSSIKAIFERKRRNIQVIVVQQENDPSSGIGL